MCGKSKDSMPDKDAPAAFATSSTAVTPPRTMVLNISAAANTDKSSGHMAKPTKIEASPPVPALETANKVWRGAVDRAASPVKQTSSKLAPPQPNVPSQSSEPIWLPPRKVVNIASLPPIRCFDDDEEKERLKSSHPDDWEAEFDATNEPSAPPSVSYMIKPHERSTVTAPVKKVKKPKPVRMHTIEKGSVLMGAVGTPAKNTSGKKANRNRMSTMKSRDDEDNDHCGSGTQAMYAAMGNDRGRGRARTGWQEVKKPGLYG